MIGEHPEIDVAIDNIQASHANALKMRAVDGLSHVEMAGALDMSPSQVKALLHRARSSFKKAWDKAQGWLLTPILGARSLDRSTQVSSTSTNLAAISAQAPALAERAAASVLIVMVALSNDPSSFSTVEQPEPPAVVAVNDASACRGRHQTRPLRGPCQTRPPKPAIVEEEAVPVSEEVLVLPETLKSTIEGSDQAAADDGGPGPTAGGQGVARTSDRSKKVRRSTRSSSRRPWAASTTDLPRGPTVPGISVSCRTR